MLDIYLVTSEVLVTHRKAREKCFSSAEQYLMLLIAFRRKWPFMVGPVCALSATVQARCFT